MKGTALAFVDGEETVTEIEGALIAFARNRHAAWVSEFSGNSSGEINLDFTIYVDGKTKVVANLTVQKIGPSDPPREKITT